MGGIVGGWEWGGVRWGGCAKFFTNFHPREFSGLLFHSSYQIPASQGGSLEKM